MSTKPTLVEEKSLMAPAVAEVGQPTLSAPAVEYVGLLAILPSKDSVHVPFVSGANGYTSSQVHIEGQLAGLVEGEISLTLRGNILVIPRHSLIDTHREIAPQDMSLSFGDKQLLQSINEVISGRAVRGVSFDACISLFDDDVKEWEEVMIATRGLPDLLRLNIPQSKTPLR